MKSVLTFGTGLLLLLSFADIAAQSTSNTTDTTKKRESVISARNMTLAGNQNAFDSVKKKSSTSALSGKGDSRTYHVISSGAVSAGKNSARINELNKEINQLVAKYKSNSIKADVKDTKTKFSQLASDQREKVRREADSYYFRIRNKAFIHGDNKTKWQLIENYYNEKYSNKKSRTWRDSDPKQTVYKEIKSKLSELFDLREDEKREEIRKLEKQVSALEKKLNERKRNKPQILGGRLKELLGEPNDLKW